VGLAAPFLHLAMFAIIWELLWDYRYMIGAVLLLKAAWFVWDRWQSARW
jgi:hypothetical protein